MSTNQNRFAQLHVPQYSALHESTYDKLNNPKSLDDVIAGLTSLGTELLADLKSDAISKVKNEGAKFIGDAAKSIIDSGKDLIGDMSNDLMDNANEITEDLDPGFIEESTDVITDNLTTEIVDNIPNTDVFSLSLDSTPQKILAVNTSNFNNMESIKPKYFRLTNDIINSIFGSGLLSINTQASQNVQDLLNGKTSENADADIVNDIITSIQSFIKTNEDEYVIVTNKKI
jgi:hypothetical protein